MRAKRILRNSLIYTLLMVTAYFTVAYDEAKEFARAHGTANHELRERIEMEALREMYIAIYPERFPAHFINRLTEEQRQEKRVALTEALRIMERYQ